jgi:hypothetical protein
LGSPKRVNPSRCAQSVQRLEEVLQGKRQTELDPKAGRDIAHVPERVRGASWDPHALAHPSVEGLATHSEAHPALQHLELLLLQSVDV